MTAFFFLRATFNAFLENLLIFYGDGAYLLMKNLFTTQSLGPADGENS